MLDVCKWNMGLKSASLWKDCTEISTMGVGCFKPATAQMEELGDIAKALGGFQLFLRFLNNGLDF